MTKYTPNFKHNILMEYRRGDRGASFSILARCHKIKGGKKSIQYWYSQWKGTPSSWSVAKDREGNSFYPPLKWTNI